MAQTYDIDTLSVQMTVAPTTITTVPDPDSYDNGYNAGKEVGAQEGYGKGYNAGKETGHQEGYGKGYTEGETAGRVAGYEDGHGTGRSEGYTEGFDQGYSLGHDDGCYKAESDFWDIVQRSGARTNYEQAFAYWDAEYLRPKYKIIPQNTRTMNMFGNMRNLKKIEKEFFDFSQASTSDTSSTQGNYTVFRGCNSLETIEDIGMPAGYYYQTYNYCPELETIEVIRSNETTMYSSTFDKSPKIKNITIEGVIGQNGFNVSVCKNLTKKSIISIVSALSETLTATKTITLPSAAVNKYFKSADGTVYTAEWMELIKPKKNWNFAFA